MISGKPFRSIRRRLLIKLTALALCAMAIVALAQVVLINQFHHQQQAKLLGQLTHSQLPALQNALWDIELSQLEGQLQHIVQLPGVAAVQLLSETGLDLRAGAVSVITSAADSALEIPSPLAGDKRLGELRVFYQHDVLIADMVKAVAARILEFSLYTLLVFAILLRVLHRDIGQPLQRIANYVGTLKPQKRAPQLVLPRAPRDWYDEIDLVAQGFDTLRDATSHYAEEHERAIELLAEERDHLDQRVAERTAELAHLNGYLKLISGSSLKLMHVSRAQYPQALSQTLRALGQYLQLDAGLLLDGTDSPQVRVRWMAQEDELWEHKIRQVDWLNVQPGWSVEHLGNRTLLIRFVSQQRYFGYAIRSCRKQDSMPEQLLLGAGQWLFGLLQHWDHLVRLEDTRAELLHMSRTDPLTGLANRRHFNEHQIGELNRAQRLNYPVSQLMIDVDFFKAFNDCYGHAEGDRCLSTLAQLLDARFKRTGELAARLGGEEFIVLLPGYDTDQAYTAAEALREAIYQLQIPHQGSSWDYVTVSIGCSTWSGAAVVADKTEVLIDGLMRSADIALYAAKHAGRNQVVSGASPLDTIPIA